VVKQVVPSTTPDGSTAGALPAGGWTFGATTITSGLTISPTSGETATGTGALNFGLTFPGGVTTGDLTVTETVQAGYTLHPVGGSNATCFRLDTTPPTQIPSGNTTNGFT